MTPLLWCNIGLGPDNDKWKCHSILLQGSKHTWKMTGTGGQMTILGEMKIGHTAFVSMTTYNSEWIYQLCLLNMEAIPQCDKFHGEPLHQLWCHTCHSKTLQVWPTISPYYSRMLWLFYSHMVSCLKVLKRDRRCHKSKNISLRLYMWPRSKQHQENPTKPWFLLSTLIAE